jgi:hypothetical protein
MGVNGELVCRGFETGVPLKKLARGCPALLGGGGSNAVTANAGKVGPAGILLLSVDNCLDNLGNMGNFVSIACGTARSAFRIAVKVAPGVMSLFLL